MSAPADTTVRIYPDLDSFRNATGEPGWVAAHTSGTTIDVQPLREMQPVLKHEILHVILESHAAPGLPIWFREGVVEWMSGDKANTEAGGDKVERDLRQRRVRSDAESAYAAAASRVSELVHRYGETAVLGWVGTGLAPEVKNSSASKDTTKSR